MKSEINVVKIMNELNDRKFSYEKVIYDPQRKVFRIIETKVPTRKTTRKFSNRKPKTYEQKIHEKVDRKIKSNENVKLSA